MRHLFVILTLATFSATHDVAGYQAALKLGSVEVVGAERYTSQDVAKVAGLTIGQPITVEGLTHAAERLGQSGLFKSLGFRYVTKGGILTVTFEFEEAEPTIPVSFDNFVWFSDAEVQAAARHGVPGFDRLVPPGDGILDLISAALQSLLKQRGIPGHIHFSPQADLKGNLLGYVFSVKDPAPKVCALRIEGATAIPQEQMGQAISIIGNEYSRSYADNAAKGTLRDRYRQLGYWAAQFEPSTAAINTGCPGVTVTLKVSEGVLYAWDRSEWTGNAALMASELSALVGLKPGEPSALTKIDDGVRAVKQAYGRKGYILAGVLYSPRLDAAARKATFEFRVAEGPQFRMGTVEFAGLADPDAAALHKKWKLASGEVFDDSYPTTFFVDVPRSALRGRQVSTQLRVDEEKRIVDVRYLLK